MRIAFIGLGHMGHGMAMRLVDSKKHEVYVYNRTQSKADEHVAHGAIRGASVLEVAQKADMVISMLADDKAVHEASESILSGLKENGIHLSMSTISVELAQKLEKTHAERKIRLVGAPVFGRPNVAAEGKLTVIAAGDEATLKECHPVLELMSQKVIPVGHEPHKAHLTKVLGNFMLLSSIEMLAESLATAEKAGLAPENFLEAMANSLFTAPFFKNYGTMMIQKSYEGGTSFALNLAMKDASLAVSAGKMPMAEFIHRRIKEAVENGMGDLDLSSLGKNAKF